jgi:hypothetical protein
MFVQRHRTTNLYQKKLNKKSKYSNYSNSNKYCNSPGEIPLDGEQSSSYFQYTQEEVHEDLGQMDEGGLNHYRQNRQSPKKVVWQHPNIITKQQIFL